MNDLLFWVHSGRGARPCTRDKQSLNDYRPSVSKGPYTVTAAGDVGRTLSASGMHGKVSCSVEHVTRCAVRCTGVGAAMMLLEAAPYVRPDTSVANPPGDSSRLRPH